MVCRIDRTSARGSTTCFRSPDPAYAKALPCRAFRKTGRPLPGQKSGAGIRDIRRWPWADVLLGRNIRNIPAPSGTCGSGPGGDLRLSQGITTDIDAVACRPISGRPKFAVRSGPIGRIDSCSRVNLFSLDDRFGIANGNVTLTPSGPRDCGSPCGEGVPPRQPIPMSERPKFGFERILRRGELFRQVRRPMCMKASSERAVPLWNSFRHFSIASIPDGPACRDRSNPWHSRLANSERERRACRSRPRAGVRLAA
jgi:hypothetical protein